MILNNTYQGKLKARESEQNALRAGASLQG